MSKKRELWIFIAIIAIAAFFRLYELDTIPPGLWPDEAANGVDALNALETRDFKIFYPNNNGREGLFINMQAVSIYFFGATPFALRIVSAIMGILTVIGLYFLSRKMFDAKIAAVASFFMAISFWHVNFSRIGFRAIMLPLILCWAFYFLWRGLKGGHLKDFFFAGIIGGIGFYTYFSYRIAPLIAILLFVNYWWYLKKDFHHAKYEHTRNLLLRGFAFMMLTVIAIALPLGVYFLTHPGDFLKRDGAPISVFAQEEPLKSLATSVVRTLGMFNLSGDYNQRHNIPGWPELSLPIGLFFAVGFLRELIHWLRMKHGHPSPTHTLLFAWFFIMLLPGFLSTEAPHALRTIGVIPVVMIFAAQGFWWLIRVIMGMHKTGDPHYYADKKIYKKESRFVLVTTILFFMTSLVAIEYSRYFIIWGSAPSLKDAFSQKLVNIANYLNADTSQVPRYVLVNEGDVLVDGVPNNAQTIKYLTRTYNNSCSAQRNIYYVNNDELLTYKFPADFILIPLENNNQINNIFHWRYGLKPHSENEFIVYR